MTLFFCVCFSVSTQWKEKKIFFVCRYIHCRKKNAVGQRCSAEVHMYDNVVVCSFINVKDGLIGTADDDAICDKVKSCGNYLDIYDCMLISEGKEELKERKYE